MLDSGYVDIFNIMYTVFLEFAVLSASEDGHYMTDYLKMGGCVDEDNFFCVFVSPYLSVSFTSSKVSEFRYGSRPSLFLLYSVVTHTVAQYLSILLQVCL
jgi:hypothetical protein